MPWNYDMDSAPKDGTAILLKNNSGYNVGYWNDVLWILDSNDDSEFINPIAWLPLPENK